MNLRRTLLVFLLAIGLLSACSSPGVSLNDISTPGYMWSQDNLLCGFYRVVDAQGGLWEGSGCERGIYFKKIGQLSDAQLRLIQDAFSKLPTPTEVKCPDTNTSGIPPHTFTKRDSATTSTRWQTCATNRLFYDTTGLAEPYLYIASMFKL